ncbi:prenyltransferase/squalene oxidase repeat-containing protein [Streptomyces sp.]|uniref:prenyltransferase/squalene oxidase repeat-containing protein n=1 Tax=Streptomyces sp. TaxID=1931 RepID=UPI002F3E21DB
MPLRRRAALLVAAASTLTALTTSVASASPPPAGLYGAADPTYDGVWRQSYALLALHTADVTPAPAAVDWLTAQQCADGGFPSFRADTAKPCAPKAEDTNATGIAVQALAALGGHGPAVAKATGWLKGVQNPDGGWSYNPGGASDPDSTAVVIGALKAAGTDPGGATSKTGHTPYDALRGFQFGCAARPAERGAFGYPMNGKLSVNAKATADAVRGARGAGFVVSAPTERQAAAPDCATSKNAYATLGPDAFADAAAAYLTAQLTAGGDHLTALTPGADQPTPDYGTTADAVVALAAGGQLAPARAAYAWLTANSATWAHANPAALSQLVLAAYATGNDPRKASGADFVRQLTNLGPAPVARATASASPTRSSAPATKQKKDGEDGSSSTSTWLIVGVFFVASVGVGFLLSGRKRQRG